MLRVQAEKLGNITVLHFRGRIVNGGATTILRKAVMSEVNTCAVVLDLAEIDLIDAGGLGTLLELREWAQSKGIEFRLMNVTRLVQQVFEITRLNSVFEISSKLNVRSAGQAARTSMSLKTAPAGAGCRRIRAGRIYRAG